MSRYLVGQVVEVTGTFRNLAGVLADPTTVALAIRKPDGTFVTPAQVPTHVSTGVYTTLITLSMAGPWTYVFTGAGTATAIDQGTVVAHALYSEIMSLAEVRQHVATNVVDDALQRIIDANALAVRDAGGVVGTVVETHYPIDTSIIWLQAAPASIGSIVERYGTMDTTLVAGDFELHGNVIERRVPDNTFWTPSLGNPTGAPLWGERVTVTYLAPDQLATQQRVLVALIKLDLTYEPGIGSRSVGAHSKSQSSRSYLAERQDILASMQRFDLGLS